MNPVHVEAVREHLMRDLQTYEAFAVMTACLSVTAYLAREMLKLGVASPRFVVIAFGHALNLAFERTRNAEQIEELGERH